jgi:hypothetical protein
VPAILFFLPRSGDAATAALAASAALTIAGIVFAGLRAVDGNGVDRRLVGAVVVSSVPLFVLGLILLAYSGLRLRP